MNWLILISTTLVFVYELSLTPPELERFIQAFALVPARWQSDPVYFAITIFTSMFMHAGWFHFLSNMWVLYIFGDNVEDRMGPASYLVFYLLSGTAAALLQTYFFASSSIPTLGASGAIAGVLGAYILLYPRARVATLVPLFFVLTVMDIPAIVFLGFWFVSQLFSGIASIGVDAGGVAWWAHIGGFVFGLLMVYVFAQRRPPRAPQVFG
jgi:membrane associated rhomboid family serine protease